MPASGAREGERDLLHYIFQHTQHCNGRYQSPISIHSRRAIPSAMPAIEFIYYHNPLPGPLTIHNNGHSVSLLTQSFENATTYRRPFIHGGKLRDEYDYWGLHFHWGDKNSRGAEHVLNDIRYPLELHMIHINRKYASIDEALNHKDGLAVLGETFSNFANHSVGARESLKKLVSKLMVVIFTDSTHEGKNGVLDDKKGH
jgi:carbonic anhydrase